MGDTSALPPLERLYFYLTEGCNLACRHCWLSPHRDDGTKKPVLPFELFETALREAKPLGLESVKLTGGEPLMHPRIGDLIEMVSRDGLELTVETNGLLLTPALADAIGAAPDPFVSVSLDGASAAVHDDIRGAEGSFEKACAAVRLLAEREINVQVITTLMKQNAAEAEEMVDLASRLGASSLKFNILQPTGRGDALHRRKGALGIEEILALGRRVESELAPEAPLAIYFDTPAAFTPLNFLAREGGSGTCGIVNILGVLAGGHWALCGIGTHLDELVFGTVGEDPLVEVWSKTPVLLELRAGLPDRLEGVCAECIMKWQCLGVCVAQNYYRKGTFWSPNWFCEEADAKGLFPPSRRR